MTVSRLLHAGLYHEHLEEASFLYEQRLAYLSDPEVDWPDVAYPEARLEAHLDALYLGREPALDICRRCGPDDLGQMHAAMRVFSRHGEQVEVFRILKRLDARNADAIRAGAEALCRDAPAKWEPAIATALSEDALVPTLARVIGYRRFQREALLQDYLRQQPELGRADLAWALGRVGSDHSVPLLRQLLEDQEQTVRGAVSLALLRLGDDLPLQALADPGDEWGCRILGIGGGVKSLNSLLRAVERGGQTAAAAVDALGLLGDLSAVGPLIDLLAHDELATHAATALNTITGAELHVRTFVPEEMDPEEWFDDERDAFENNSSTPSRGGHPLGVWVRRPLGDQAGWHRWLDENKTRFSRDLRWRMGRPYGPASLLECLAAATTPFRIRCATYEELVVRYGLTVPFEADLPVALQMRFLKKIADWVADVRASFAQGRWYRAGSLIDA